MENTQQCPIVAEAKRKAFKEKRMQEDKKILAVKKTFDAVKQAIAAYKEFDPDCQYIIMFYENGDILLKTNAVCQTSKYEEQNDANK